MTEKGSFLYPSYSPSITYFVFQPEWTGYTWDTVQYPDHVALLGWLHSLGLPIGANLHDAEGVMDFELRYPEMAKGLFIYLLFFLVLLLCFEPFKVGGAFHERFVKLTKKCMRLIPKRFHSIHREFSSRQACFSHHTF